MKCYKIIGTLLLCIILITGPVYPTKVTLTPEYTATDVTINCTVSDSQPKNFMIHLYCPFVENGICFSNCAAHCRMNGGKCEPYEELRAFQCQHRSLSPGEISTSYKIKTSEISKTGDYSCTFKNYRSSSISLVKYEPPASTTAVYEETVPVPIKHVTISNPPDVVDIGLTTRSSVATNKEDKSIEATTKNNTHMLLKLMTSNDLVLVLLILLGISLLLNLSFLIRCVLLKSVIENYYRGIPNGRCILECLCLDLVSHKYADRKYSRSMTMSNQVSGDFYRCQPMCSDTMAIYEDLSAVSKMRSNLCSDVDEETRLINVMSNGGCHVNPLAMGSVSSSLTRRYPHPSHAAYFHPGLGNYVIVSGPVASNDQYSVGTAPSGYALQMVSPIPSAPGSIGGGPGTHHSASSAHSDESDNDSRTALSASMASGIPYRTGRVNSQPIDLRESAKLMDLSHNFVMPINGLDHPQPYHHHDNNHNYTRSNGSVPLHPWPKEALVAATSSISSLPYYPVSENGACNKEVKNTNPNEKLPSPPKDVPLTES